MSHIRHFFARYPLGVINALFTFSAVVAYALFVVPLLEAGTTALLAGFAATAAGASTVFTVASRRTGRTHVLLVAWSILLAFSSLETLARHHIAGSLILILSSFGLLVALSSPAAEKRFLERDVVTVGG